MPDASAQPPIVVVLDSNVWISECLLRSRQGTSLLHHLRQNNIRLVIPEVVEEEVKGKAREKLQSLAKGASELRRFVGDSMRFVLPSVEDIHLAVDAALYSITGLTVRVPITMDHVKEALTKVIDKVPPTSSKEEQFRDTLIWEAAVSFLPGTEVHFVSTDPQFFDKQSDDLAKGLIVTLGSSDDKLVGHRNLSSCLKALNALLKVSRDDSQAIVVHIQEWLDQCIRAHYGGSRVSFHIDGVEEVNVFADETSQDKQIAFELAFSMYGTAGGRSQHGFVRVRGEGLSVNSRMTSIVLNDVEVDWGDPSAYATPYGTRATKYRRVDGEEFWIEFWAPVSSEEEEQHWYQFIAAHGVEIRRPFKIDMGGVQSGLSTRGTVPAREVWETFLADMEQQHLIAMTVEGPIPWQWEEDEK